MTNEILNFKNLQRAAEDFRYLLNRDYSRKASLELVGNHYQLTADHRHLLHRGVFADLEARSRRKKKVSTKDLLHRDLAIDGHNVLITIEAGLLGRPLILGDDGFIRDISGLSGSFKKTETTDKAIRFIIHALKNMKPRQTLFLFDAPISRSGKLAQEVRRQLREENLSGEALAVKVPEKFLIGFQGVIASSDTAILDQSKKLLDLAGHILGEKTKLESLVQLERKGGPIGKR
jgi:hypothetical protein